MYSFGPKLLPSHSWQGIGIKAIKEGFAFGPDWHGCLCTQQQNQVINLCEDERFASPGPFPRQDYFLYTETSILQIQKYEYLEMS